MSSNEERKAELLRDKDFIDFMKETIAHMLDLDQDDDETEDDVINRIIDKFNKKYGHIYPNYTKNDLKLVIPDLIKREHKKRKILFIVIPLGSIVVAAIIVLFISLIGKTKKEKNAESFRRRHYRY